MQYIKLIFAALPPLLLLASTEVHAGLVSLYCKPSNIIMLPSEGDIFNGTCKTYDKRFKDTTRCYPFNITFDTEGTSALKEYGSKTVLPLKAKTDFDFEFELNEVAGSLEQMKQFKVDRRDLTFSYTETIFLKIADDTSGVLFSLDGNCEITKSKIEEKKF